MLSKLLLVQDNLKMTAFKHYQITRAGSCTIDIRCMAFDVCNEVPSIPDLCAFDALDILMLHLCSFENSCSHEDWCFETF